MSHILEARTQISMNVDGVYNPELVAQLRAVLEAVAGRYEGGEIKDYFLDYYSRQQPCALALYVQGLSRGLGIRIDQETGAVSFIGDSWGVRDLYAKLQLQITQTYVARAVALAMQKLGWATEAEEIHLEGNPHIVVTGQRF